MLRSWLMVPALVGLCSLTASAAGTSYADPQGRFALTVPEAWEAAQPQSDDKIALVMAGGDVKEGTGGICVVLINSTPETKGVAQAELDSVFGTMLTREFWEATVGAGAGKDVTIVETGQAEQKGRKTYFAIATMTGTNATGPVAAKSKLVLNVIPGSLHFINCLSKTENFAQLLPTFEAIYASYVPKSGAIVAQAPSNSVPSVLTLFAGPQFDGAARVVAQNMPNIPALGGVTASLSVAGYGLWEVCEGVNYGGTCQLVSAGLTSTPGKSMRIGSARRHLGDADLRGAAGVISTGAAIALRVGQDRIGR